MSQMHTVVVKVTAVGAQAASTAIRAVSSASRLAGSSVEFLRRSLASMGSAIGLVTSGIRSVFSALTSLRSLFFAWLTVQSVSAVAKLADAWVLARNRISAFVDDTREVVAIQEELFLVAQRSRVDFSSVANLYQRLLVSQGTLRESNQGLLDITETLNKAIIVSGSNAKEASAGIIQLAQGLAAGALRGDELRSVIEQLPYIAQLIADELGRVQGRVVNRGELVIFGRQMEITTKLMVDAVRNGTKEVNERFSRMSVTIEQSMQVLRNSVERFLGILGQSIGFIPEFTDRVLFASRMLDNFTSAVDNQAVKLEDLKLAYTDVMSQIERFGKVDGGQLSIIPLPEEVWTDSSVQTVGDVLWRMLSRTFARLRTPAIDLIGNSLAYLAITLPRVLLFAFRDALPIVLELLYEIAKAFGNALVQAIADASPRMATLFGIEQVTPDTPDVGGILDKIDAALASAQSGRLEAIVNNVNDITSSVISLSDGLTTLAEVARRARGAVSTLKPGEDLGVLNSQLSRELDSRVDELLAARADFSNFDRSPDANKAIREFAAEARRAWSTDWVTTEQVVDKLGLRDAVTNVDELGVHVDLAKFKTMEFKQALDRLAEDERLRRMFEDIGSTIASVFETIVFQLDSVEDAIEDMVKNVAKMVFNTLVTQQIAGFFTSIIGAGFGGARGFAMGGVIDRPTFLGFADGSPAYGGESGPEAVVPLPDGRQIPVMLRGGEGGGGQQNITNINMTVKTPDADSFRRSSRQISDDLQSQLRRRR